MSKSVVLVALTLIISLLVSQNASAKSVQFPDCSQQGRFNATWGTDLVNKIKSLNPAANPTNNWALTYNFSSATASNTYLVVIWASPITNRTVGQRTMWYTHNATDPKKIEFNIDSSKGDVYRIPVPVSQDGTLNIQGAVGTWYDVPWAKTVNVPVSCATLNHRTPVTDITSGLVWDLSQTAMTVQDVNLGFFDPEVTTTSGGTTGGTVTVEGALTKDELVEVMLKGIALALSGYIAVLIISQFRWRHYD